jgi:hypothetical protein
MLNVLFSRFIRALFDISSLSVCYLIRAFPITPCDLYVNLFVLFVLFCIRFNDEDISNCLVKAFYLWCKIKTQLAIERKTLVIPVDVQAKRTVNALNIYIDTIIKYLRYNARSDWSKMCNMSIYTRGQKFSACACTFHRSKILYKINNIVIINFILT